MLPHVLPLVFFFFFSVRTPFSTITQHLILAYWPNTQIKICPTLYNLYIFFQVRSPHSRFIVGFFLHADKSVGICSLAGPQYDASGGDFLSILPSSHIVYFMFSGLHAINTHENMLTSRLSEKPKIYWPHDKNWYHRSNEQLLHAYIQDFG